MLPKKNRLTKKKDFEKVFQTGKGTKEGFLFLKWALNNLNISRFGFVVGRKISKKSTLRNQIKRKLREIIRLKLPKIKRGLDGVFIIRAGLSKKDFPQLEESLNKILTKAKILKE